MYICKYVNMYSCIYMYSRIYMYICICAYVYNCICVYMYLCIYVYMYICKYVKMYMCICTYIHIHKDTYLHIYIFLHAYSTVCNLTTHVYLHSWTHIYTWVHARKAGTSTLPKPSVCVSQFVFHLQLLPVCCVLLWMWLAAAGWQSKNGLVVTLPPSPSQLVAGLR